MSMTPAVRFKGFTDPWEQRKLGNIATRITAMSGEADLPRVEYEDINSGQGTLNKDLASKESAKTGIAFEPGDVLYGKLRPYLMNWLYPQFRGIAVGDFWVLRPDGVEGSFLYRFIQSERFQYNANISSGSKMPRADWAFVSEDNYLVPSSRDEQRLIGTTFQQLDNLITLHQRKYDQLVVLKKALLDKMFPRDGAVVPEIRFAGFTDPWEQRKLGELGTTYGGLTGKSKEDFGHGDARFVPYTNVFDNPIADPTRLGEVEIDMSQNRVLHGDALFTVSSETPEEVGMSSVWLSDLDNLYLNSFCFGYRQDGSFDSYYLAYMLRSKSVREDIELLAQGISRFNISKGKVMEVEVPVPDMEEQRRVGTLFYQLDNLITLHQRKLGLLKNLKAALLDKMFV